MKPTLHEIIQMEFFNNIYDRFNKSFNYIDDNIKIKVDGDRVQLNFIILNRFGTNIKYTIASPHYYDDWNAMKNDILFLEKLFSFYL